MDEDQIIVFIKDHEVIKDIRAECAQFRLKPDDVVERAFQRLREVRKLNGEVG